jgi:hypothetical protein
MCRKALIGARSAVAALKIAAVAAVATVAAHTGASAASPFDRLAGSWTGGGRVTFEGGQTERLRCNARYASSGSGNRLDLTIRCASPATSFELRGDLAYRGGRVSGNWQERTLGASGRAAGRANAGSIVMRISGAASGSMSVALSGRAQTVTVSTVDTALRGINVSLRRR